MRDPRTSQPWNCLPRVYPGNPISLVTASPAGTCSRGASARVWVRLTPTLSETRTRAEGPVAQMVVWRIFPLLSEEGWLRDQKSRAASLARADGVVFNPNKILSNLITTSSAPQRRLRDILLMSRPPLLGEEGKVPHTSPFRQQPGEAADFANKIARSPEDGFASSYRP